MQFVVVKSKSIKIFLCMILTLVLLSVNFGGEKALAQVYFNKTFKKVPIYNVETDKKQVAISFDAAWGADKTEKIMAILKEYNCDATFFLVGFWVDKYPELTKKIAEQGFEIGTHSNTHPDLTKKSSNEIKLELDTSVSKIINITKKPVKLFRAPFGAYDNKVLDMAESLNLTTIQWDVDSLDWQGISADQISKNILTKVKNGSIILCHNNSDHIVEALPSVLNCLKDRGYQVTSVSNLIYKDNYIINSQGTQISQN